MKLRDMVQVKKKDLGDFIEVDAELSVRCTFTSPSSDLLSPHLDPFEEAESRVLKEIDEAIFGEARRAFDMFDQEVGSLLTSGTIEIAGLMRGIEEAARRVRQTLSIYGER